MWKVCYTGGKISLFKQNRTEYAWPPWYSYVQAISVCAASKGGAKFLRRFGMNGYRLCPLGFGIGYGSRGNSKECKNVFIVSIDHAVERKRNMRIFFVLVLI